MLTTVEEQTIKALALLQSLIKEQGFTQLEIQNLLGWGRSYISQLMTRQKGLRFDQILSILGVIDVEPAEFFAQLYRIPLQTASLQEHREEALKMVETIASDFETPEVVQGLAQLLVEQGLLRSTDVLTAIEKRAGQR